MIKKLNATMVFLMVTCGFGSSYAQIADLNIAGPCVHYNDRQSCVSYPTGECFWDEADQRCENRFNSEDRCSSYGYQRCISTWGCFWDQEDQRCERR